MILEDSILKFKNIYENTTISFQEDIIDVKFIDSWYNTWYSELDIEQVELKDIIDSGHCHNFQELLNSLNLSILDLPHDFSPKLYESLHEVLPDNNPYFAIVHFLQHGVYENYHHRVNFEFYTGYYRDLSDVILNIQDATEHWLTYGRYENGRFATFRSLLDSYEFYSEQVLSQDEWVYLYSNYDDISTKNYYEASVYILEVESVYKYKVSTSHRTNSRFYSKLGAYFESKGLDDKAKLLYEQALNLCADPELMENIANIYFRKQCYIEAAYYYDSSIQEGYSSFWTYHNLAKCSMHYGKYDEALEIVLIAIDKFPDADSLNSVFGEILREKSVEFDRILNLISITNKRQKMIALTEGYVSDISNAFSRYYANLSKEHVMSGELNEDRVLIIGDFFVPQCVRYRIDQKVEQLRIAGFSASTVSWTNLEDMKTAINFADQIIFYRVPALLDVIDAISYARALGKITIYEIDDLLFHPEYPPSIESYGGFVDQDTYVGLTKGMPLFRAAAQLCDYGIASTPALVKELQLLVRSNKAYVHRNGLDHLNMNSYDNYQESKHTSESINIFYGSGTMAHNDDFIDEVLPVLEKLLDKYSNLRLTIMGYLNLPSEFTERFKDQISLIPITSDLQVYWGYLSSADINIAVLTSDTVNNCKSELKWFEAGLYGIPSVVSGTTTFREVINDNIDGFVVCEQDEWFRVLESLVLFPKLREEIGKAAQERILSEYSLDALANNIKVILSDINATIAK